MTARNSSIAFRLVAAVLAVEFLSSVLVILLAWGYERHTHFRAFDVMLRGRADSVLGAVQDAEDVGDNVMLDLADLHVPPEDVYEVWDGRGHLLGRSSNWQGSVAISLPRQNGIFAITLDHRDYRMLRLRGSRIVDPGETGGGKLRPVTILYAAPTAPVWHAIRGAVEFYAAGSLLLLAVTGPLIAWLLHRGLAPLRELASLAGQVSVDSWEFSPPASARTTRELAPLTHALENALERLERSFNQQRIFVSDAAHELKTAVAVVKSSIQLLALRPRTAAEYQSGLDRCLSDTSRLEDLVAKMLTLARIENQLLLGSASSHCNLSDCVFQVLDQSETVAGFRGVRLAVISLPPNCHIPLGAEDCQLLVSNLLMNALEHSFARSVVEIRSEILGRAVELTITDHGEGIPPDALPHVFERFYRGDPSRTRATGGAGLGLAMCKAVVEEAQGTIELQSEQGVGTTAIVRLPLAEPPSSVSSQSEGHLSAR
ncbi:MAG TPA: HAMP domain-containing sensor histidine kinase [Terracidiphilus sp.]|nr:HAMP domain-containing sensor histidine kinase [Terracidiphilus sp.]